MALASLVITRCIRSSPFGPFATRMFASASCLRSPAQAGISLCSSFPRVVRVALPFKGRVGWGWCCRMRVISTQCLSSSSSFRRKPESSSLLFGSSESKSFHSPAAGELLLPLRKSNQKARRPTRCFAAHPAPRNPLCFSAEAGRRELAHLCAQTSAPCSRFRLRCSAPRKAPGSANPSIHGLRSEILASATGSRRNGAPVARRAGAGSARRVARTRRASLRMYTDVHQANPGACSRTRSTGTVRRARHRGVLSFGYLSLHEQRKVTRSPQARGSPCFSNLQAKQRYWIPAFAGMTSKASGGIANKGAIV